MTSGGQTKIQGSIRGWLAAFMFGMVVLAGATGAVLALHARATIAPDAEPGPPLAVTVTPLRIVDHHIVRESYAGRIEPARETRAAFERAGLVVAVEVEEGDRVAAGQVLARLDTDALEIEQERLRAERAAIEADIDLARRTEARRESLVDEGWASGQQYDEARLSAAALRARRDAVDAALARVALDLKKSVLTAPFAGLVATRAIDEGAVVSAGTEVVHLQETDRPQARIGIPADRRHELSSDQPVELTYQGQRISGQVAAIPPDLEPETRTVPVLIDLDPNSALTMGEVVRLTLERTVSVRGAWVPLTALKEGERGLWTVHTIVAMGQEHAVRSEAVEILQITEGQAFIRGTISDGARVVVEGPHRLTVGQSVTIADSVGS